jgi:hypothetical protein
MDGSRTAGTALHLCVIIKTTAPADGDVERLSSAATCTQTRQPHVSLLELVLVSLGLLVVMCMFVCMQGAQLRHIATSVCVSVSIEER